MKYGLFKSEYDERDLLLKPLVQEVSIPEEYDITHRMSPVRNQGNEGSCVGFATAVGVKEYQERTGLDANADIKLSPRYVYEEAKLISGHTEGTTLRAAMQVVREKGVCEEKFWPYIPEEPNDPSPIADKNAEKFKVLSYLRITTLTELKQAIVKFGATLIGVNVFKTFVNNRAQTTGIVDDPSCFERMKVLGGHAITAVGYDDDSPFYKDGHIKFKNSWGEDFGLKGYGVLSYKYIQSNMVDAFLCVDIDLPPIITVASLPKTRGLWV